MITLGLLSDSHGRAVTTHCAVQLLIEHGADVLIHLGDVGSAEVIDALAAVDPKTGRQIPAHVVFGNTDWDKHVLTRYAQDLGISVHEPAGLLTIDGCRIGFTHGHEPAVMQELLNSGVAYLLYGHTHLLSDELDGRTRMINPGALFRASRYTAALLRPMDGVCEVLEVASVVR